MPSKLRGTLRLFPAAIVLATSLAVVACQSDSVTSPPPTPPSGAYVLQTINGSVLPFLVTNSDGSSTGVTVIASFVVLNPDSSFVEETTVRSEEYGSKSQSTGLEQGTYSVSGTAITLTASDSTVTSGTVTNSALSFTNAGYTFNYTR